MLLFHTALGNVMSPPRSVQRKETETRTAGITAARSPRSTWTSRLTDRRVSDTVRVWKHWMPLYGLHGAITQTHLHIYSYRVCLSKSPWIINHFCFCFVSLFFSLLNCRTVPALANQNESGACSSDDSLVFGGHVTMVTKLSSGLSDLRIL